MNRVLASLLAPVLGLLPGCARSADDVSAAEAAKMIDSRRGDRDFVLLDVRTPGEVSQGRIPGSKNLDFNAPDFAEKVAALDPSKTYLVHCAAGARSKKAETLMKATGFGKVYNMLGGFQAWAAEGLPVEK